MNTVYEYEKHFETSDKAKEVAEYFHEVLKGNPDYKNSRILLNVERDRVLLVEFDDSATHIHVVEEEGEPVIELFIR